MVKISVDQDTCIGCGACVAICPKSFRMVNGKAQPTKLEVKKVDLEKEAEASCPVSAIKVE